MGDSSDSGGRTSARDHDGYSHSEHFFGDACPGGHLDRLTSDLLFDKYEADPWLDGPIGDRRDIYRSPTAWLDNEERLIEEIRSDETFAWERLERGTGPVTDINRARTRRREQQLMDAEESWESLDPYYDGSFE